MTRARKPRKSYAVEFARKGGHARAQQLTAKQRSAASRKAARARWRKARAKTRRGA